MSTASPGTKAKRKPRVKKDAAQRAAEAKRAAEAGKAGTGGTAVPLGARIRARVGESGARSVLTAVRAGLMAATGAVAYVLAMFTAVTVVPNVFVVVSTGTGVGPTSPLELQLVHWLAPSLFLIGLIFVLVLVVVRSLWLARRRLGEKARRALLGDPVDSAPTTDGADG